MKTGQRWAALKYTIKQRALESVLLNSEKIQRFRAHYEQLDREKYSANARQIYSGNYIALESALIGTGRLEIQN